MNETTPSVTTLLPIESATTVDFGPKPGMKTSELVVTMLIIALGSTLASGLIVNNTALQIAGVAMATLKAIAYTWSRTQVKVAQATAGAMAGNLLAPGTIDPPKPNGFIALRLLMLLAVMCFVLIACGAAARQKSITASLIAVDSAQAAFLVYDGPHELDLAAQALNKDDYAEKVAAYRKQRAKFNLAMKAAYDAVRIAAQLDDDHSVAGMVAAVTSLAQAAATLGVTP